MQQCGHKFRQRGPCVDQVPSGKDLNVPNGFVKWFPWVVLHFKLELAVSKPISRQTVESVGSVITMPVAPPIAGCWAI